MAHSPLYHADGCAGCASVGFLLLRLPSFFVLIAPPLIVDFEVSMTRSSSPHLVIAMDFASAEECLAMAHRLSPQLCRLKVGKELFTTRSEEHTSELQSRPH